MNLIGSCYVIGTHGRSKKRKKAEELLQRASDLGDLTAAHGLAELYRYTNHFPDQVCIMKYIIEEGATRGNTHCNNFLAIRAAQSGNHEEAKRHFMTAARSGDDQAIQNLMVDHREPAGSVVSKNDLATVNSSC